MKTDVIIVGAGPTGLALACQFIRHNIDFVILDKKQTTTPHSTELDLDITKVMKFSRCYSSSSSKLIPVILSFSSISKRHKKIREGVSAL